jgi:Uma2 family endonuclease
MASMSKQPLSDTLVANDRSPTHTAQPLSSEDRFVYGWRAVPEMQANGQRRWTRIPLTIQDVLHPQEEDILMPNEEHERLRTYLYNVISYQLRNDPTALLLSNTNIAWEVGTPAPRPDIAVIYNVRSRKNWSTFNVTEEGTRPRMILEITSPKTRHLDFEDKYREYEGAGVEFYFIVDLRQGRHGVNRTIHGYRLTPEGYVPLQPNARGWLWVEPLSIWLVVREHGVVCHDAAGNFMADYADVLQAKLYAEARAVEEAAIRAEEATIRAAAEARAAEETRRRIELEARLAALEAELKRRSNPA